MQQNELFRFQAPSNIKIHLEFVVWWVEGFGQEKNVVEIVEKMFCGNSWVSTIVLRKRVECGLAWNRLSWQKMRFHAHDQKFATNLSDFTTSLFAIFFLLANNILATWTVCSVVFRFYSVYGNGVPPWAPFKITAERLPPFHRQKNKFALRSRRHKEK